MVILENIDIDIDIDKAILQNIDIDKISNRFKFGISNRAKNHWFGTTIFKVSIPELCLKWVSLNTGLPLEQCLCWTAPPPRVKLQIQFWTIFIFSDPWKESSLINCEEEKLLLLEGKKHQILPHKTEFQQQFEKPGPPKRENKNVLSF